MQEIRREKLIVQQYLTQNISGIYIVWRVYVSVCYRCI